VASLPTMRLHLPPLLDPTTPVTHASEHHTVRREAEAKHVGG
jgi:hypothetical protein